MMWRGGPPMQVVTAEQALPGRDEPIPTSHVHKVLGTSIHPPWPDGYELLVVGMGCFWGAERLFWELDGVHTTFVGYAGGHTRNPTYQEVCSGMTGHAEVAAVVYDPGALPLDALFAVFWENHDPTQHMRQGNDVGTQYRSVLFVDEDQRPAAEASRIHYQHQLDASGFGRIETSIEERGEVYWAEDYHQQYLHVNPGGYCNHGFCQAAY